MSGSNQPGRVTRTQLSADVLVAVAAGGAVGAAARYGLATGWPTPAGGFPWVTLVINLVGCALLGALLELLGRRPSPPRLARPFLGTGALGGFTTFSFYAVESRQLLAAGRPGLAATYVTVTLVGALAAVWLAIVTVRWAGWRRLRRRRRAGSTDRLTGEVA